MISIREALYEASAFLDNSETPYLDSVILLSHAIGVSKEKLLASYPDPLEQEKHSYFNELLEKRKSGIPVSYLISRKEFYGLSFYVDERVLVPRPDSETLVEESLRMLKKNCNFRSVLDLCTGSGALGIALKYCEPGIEVTCSDISEAALEVCRKNSREILGAEIRTVKSSLFEEITGSFDIIVTNPPYLTDLETSEMMKSGWPEPENALAGGSDGLDFIREIVEKAADYLNNSGYLLIESSINQTEIIKKLMEIQGFEDTVIFKDMSGRNRVTAGRKRI